MHVLRFCVCETDAEVSETAGPDLELTYLVAWEDFVTNSCRQRFLNKIDIKVLFGGRNDWATGWTARARIPICARDFSPKLRNQLWNPPSLPCNRYWYCFSSEKQQAVLLTTDIHLAPTLGKRGPVIILPVRACGASCLLPAL
jgi:hypothetical protein